MEPVIYAHSPLAEYLKDEGGEFAQAQWVTAAPDPASDGSDAPPSPGLVFAPTGRPDVRARFRPRAGLYHAPRVKRILARFSLTSLATLFPDAVASSFVPIENARFLEQFRYVIIASHLLSGHIIPGQQNLSAAHADSIRKADTDDLSTAGAATSLLCAFLSVYVLTWLSRAGRVSSWRDSAFFIATVCVAITFVVAIVRRQWLRHMRNQALRQISGLLSISHDLDAAVAAAITLVQEVELISRGYRISAPLPPISRLEEKSPSRKCNRLRKALACSLAEVLRTYQSSTAAIDRFSDQASLEKYYDIYDLQVFDIADALRGHSEAELDDPESLRALKILGARIDTLRKLLLCALLALNAVGDTKDLLPWTTAVEAISSLSSTSTMAYDSLQAILNEEESFSIPLQPKVPLTPGRERWRSQLRKLNPLSLGIRGLQAKLQLLREESDRALNESPDMSEMVPGLIMQYDSIGIDLRDLTQAWEEGKTALAQGIERNERRLSSMSAMQSPTSSMSGLTTVEEGGAAEALRSLTGESPSRADFDIGSEEVFEAIVSPSRPRSIPTREDRISAMREERERKARVREQAEATRGMLRELEMVIKPRARSKSGV